MNEKLKAILNKDTLKELSKKIFTKKKIGAVIAVVVIAAGLKLGYSQLFDIEGTVLKIDGKNIVVSNFLGTRTINTGDYPIDGQVVVGDKVEISKNLSGDVTDIRTGGGKRGGARSNPVIGSNKFGFDNNRTERDNNNFDVQKRGKGDTIQRQGRMKNGALPGKDSSDSTSGATVKDGVGSQAPQTNTQQ